MTTYVEIFRPISRRWGSEADSAANLPAAERTRQSWPGTKSPVAASLATGWRARPTGDPVAVALGRPASGGGTTASISASSR